MDELEGRRISKKVVGSVVLVVVIVSLLGVMVFHKKTVITPPSQPLATIPLSVRRSVSFPLYFPSAPSPGYSLLTDSVRTDSGVVFFAFSKGVFRVFVSEQTPPQKLPDFQKLKDLLGFKKLDEPYATDAVIGAYAGQPTAIILTNTTMITLTSANNTPSDVIIDFAKSLHSL